MSEFDWIWNAQPLETTEQVDSRAIAIQNKRRLKYQLQQKRVSEFLTELPSPQESLHIISNGAFDCFTFIPVLLDLLPKQRSEHFYASTWAMSHTVVLDLFQLFDSGKIGTINILTGVDFKRRKTAIYAALVSGMQERKQRYVAFENHSKIMLLNSGEHHIVIEGSANLTANPRLEQNVIVNDKSLWQFHRMWMEEMYNG